MNIFLSNRRAFSWREDVIKLLANVSDDAEALPSSARLENVHLEKPKIVTFGPWGEIAQGKYKGMLVAMKKMKSPQLIKQSRREVLTNLIASVDHPNVHPLLGFVNGVELIVISQWQEYGDLNAFLRRLKARGERPNFPMLVILTACPLLPCEN
ncbi:hypothetical protein BS47DRAFT_216659 [Hydnum rufescens UP504]|uniref:Serine-threonine/tyrosine-protein kinase catalytic domain-containing protein n=1 Tax=Hydnum rufescens UP504 TaxID=1448309 RepID=A0A9P6AMB3_9AGAM|nr:hypothetical protein BS47DRAFT_216659 [Hydnum rufescens UP504]